MTFYVVFRKCILMSQFVVILLVIIINRPCAWRTSYVSLNPWTCITQSIVWVIIRGLPNTNSGAHAHDDEMLVKRETELEIDVEFGNRPSAWKTSYVSSGLWTCGTQNMIWVIYKRFCWMHVQGPELEMSNESETLRCTDGRTLCIPLFFFCGYLHIKQIDFCVWPWRTNVWIN